jgi:hypothetical protein
MKTLFLLVLVLIGSFKGNAQTPLTKEKIQSFIDSIGNSSGKQLISSAMYPAVADGTNFEWKNNIWRNKKKQLLWVERIIPNSISTVFFYRHDILVFVGERTYVADSISNKRKSIFREIFFSNSAVIADTAPGRNANTVIIILKRVKST